MLPYRLAPWITALLLGIAGAVPAASAQEPGGDDALDRLLEKVDRPDSAADPKPGPAERGAVDKGDEDLDNLLKKLGETPDTPDAKGKPGAPGPGTEPPKPPADTRDQGPSLEGKEKALDEHLEELTGRKRKPRDDQPQAGDDSSPLADAIKKMEEARKRLSEADTGEGTRKTQGEIVKELDQILQRLRQQQGSGSGMRMARRTQQAGQGNRPGDSQGDPGNTGAGVGASSPKRPTVGEMLAGRKDIWGDLPPNLREEMENVFKEDMLPAKQELIRRYYSSVAKKGRAREEVAR